MLLLLAAQLTNAGLDYKMKNVNQYNEVEFTESFKKTKIYQSLNKDFDLVYFGNNVDELVTSSTPRHIIGLRRTSAVPFYYLEFLTEKTPETIYDLGCGWNLFKRYIPNIIGIGAENVELDQFFGDIHDFVDDDYVKNHQEYFESVFSINALHFHPLSELRKIATDFASMIKPGGMGYLALNLEKMLAVERDKEKFKDYTTADLDVYVRQQLNDLPISVEYLVFDVDLTVRDAYMDGNIRFVCQRL